MQFLNNYFFLRRRRSLTLGNGGTVISCLSPRPRRDSLTLLQERYSGSATPHSGYYRLSGSENKRVEFIRELGNTITPMLHLGREARLVRRWKFTQTDLISAYIL